MLLLPRGRPLLQHEEVQQTALCIDYVAHAYFPYSTPKTERERKSVDGRFAEVKTACIVINTADYCQTTAIEVSSGFMSLSDTGPNFHH